MWKNYEQRKYFLNDLRLDNIEVIFEFLFAIIYNTISGAMNCKG
jgi:hypothetical protein